MRNTVPNYVIIIYTLIVPNVMNISFSGHMKRYDIYFECLDLEFKNNFWVCHKLYLISREPKFSFTLVDTFFRMQQTFSYFIP